MLITEPPPDLSRWGTASWVRLNAVDTFQWKASLKKRSLVRRKGCGMLPPALFTTTSMRPSSASERSTSACIPSRARRSTGTTTARRPSDLVELALCPRADRDVGADLGQRPGDAGADAATRPRHDRDLAVEPEAVEDHAAHLREQAY